MKKLLLLSLTLLTVASPLFAMNIYQAFAVKRPVNNNITHALDEPSIKPLKALSAIKIAKLLESDVNLRDFQNLFNGLDNSTQCELIKNLKPEFLADEKIRSYFSALTHYLVLGIKTNCSIEAACAIMKLYPELLEKIIVDIGQQQEITAETANTIARITPYNQLKELAKDWLLVKKIVQSLSKESQQALAKAFSVLFFEENDKDCVLFRTTLIEQLTKYPQEVKKQEYSAQIENGTVVIRNKNNEIIESFKATLSLPQPAPATFSEDGRFAVILTPDKKELDTLLGKRECSYSFVVYDLHKNGQRKAHISLLNGNEVIQMAFDNKSFFCEIKAPDHNQFTLKITFPTKFFYEEFSLLQLFAQITEGAIIDEPSLKLHKALLLARKVSLSESKIEEIINGYKLVSDALKKLLVDDDLLDENNLQTLYEGYNSTKLSFRQIRNRMEINLNSEQYQDYPEIVTVVEELKLLQTQLLDILEQKFGPSMQPKKTDPEKEKGDQNNNNNNNA